MTLTTLDAFSAKNSAGSANSRMRKFLMVDFVEIFFFFSLVYANSSFSPRGGHNTSPVASPAEHEIPRQLGLHPGATDYGRPRSASSTPVSPRTNKNSHPSPELLPGLSAKRMRFSYDDYPRHPPPPTSRPSTMIPIPEIKKATSNGMPTWQHHDLPRDILCRPWQTDPYVFVL